MSLGVDRRFVPDAEAHRRDAPRFCPRCATGLAMATEFWEADERRFYCSCTGCGWTGRELTGGPVNIGDIFGRPRNFTIVINCISSGLATLYDDCGLTWEES